MVIAANEADASRVKTLALHGMSKDAWKRFGDDGFKHYQVVECGFKYNMMDIQAAIGIHQLKRIEASWIRRQAIWQQYDKAFQDLPIALPATPAANTRHAFHLYTVLVGADSGTTRDEFLNHMTRSNIGVGVHYMSVPEHPYYQQEYGWDPDAWPHARDVGRQTVSLPISPKLTDEDVARVINAVYEAFPR
jgi:dTDP-4-amino-4,6-dideoxygalactose transaminase